MKMYFLTRKEARKYCKQIGVPYSKIGRDVNGARSWCVDAEEVTNFQIGKVYKITDEAGFVKANHYSVVNTANRIQLQQIKRFLPDGVKITHLDTAKQIATFEAPVGVSFNTIRFEEAQYFSEVKPIDVKTPAKVVDTIKPVKPAVKPVANVLADLDAELNGGVCLADTNPTEWVAGKAYILTNRDAFIKSCSVNYRIVEGIEQFYNGVFYVKHVSKDKGAEFDTEKCRNHCQNYLYASERQYFRETAEVDVAVNGERNKLIRDLLAASEVHKQRVEEFGKSIDAVKDAFEEIIKIANKLTSLK